MKKKSKSGFFCLFFIFHLSTTSFLVTAQISIQTLPTDPGKWGEFVNGSKNPIQRDTFRMQTFSGSPKDTWNYTTQGDVEIFDASKEGIENQGGSSSIRLTPGSEIRFESYSVNRYTDIRINFRFASKDLQIGQNLLVSATRSPNPLTDYPVYKATNPPAISSYLDHLKDKINQITSNPSDLIFRVEPGNSTGNGFYCLDSVYAFGLLPSYTLFSGTGNWETTERWSHHPPLPSQRALVQGKATVNTPLSCRSLAIGGSVFLAADIHLQTDELSFYSPATVATDINKENYLVSEGTLEVSGTTSVSKTFPQTGAWYFFSLPFDVYSEGLDPAFEWKDDEPNAGGNFFYLLRYNEQHRASTHTPEGNWEILRPHSNPSDAPVLRKNQGYLIALDAAADTRTLRFTSRASAIPETFGRTGEISLQFTTTTGEANDLHAGWNLCGNPFPAALPLAALSADASTDGYIYMYDGTTYQRYAFGSDYMIPPFTAFFIKSSRTARLTWQRQTASSLRHLLIPLPPAFHASLSGMEKVFEEPGAVPLATASLPDISLKGSILYMYDMPSDVLIRLNDSSGRLLYRGKAGTGNSRIALPPARGICFLTVEAQGFTRRIKYRME